MEMLQMLKQQTETLKQTQLDPQKQQTGTLQSKQTYAVCKTTSKEFVDYTNKSGVLLRHIKEVHPSFVIPSNWKRNQLKKTQNINWLDEFFTYIEKEIDVPKTHSCKVCGWETKDIDNKSGYLKTHLKKEHNLSHKDYIKLHPSEETFFKKDVKIENFIKDKDNWVECKECNKKFVRLSSHLKQIHGMSKIEYMNKHGVTSSEMISKKFMDLSIKNSIKGNLALNEKSKKLRYSSIQENEIYDMLINNNINVVKSNRSILKGKEIDIVSHELKIGIEFNGCKWHSEWYGGKDRHYHLNKTLGANEQGYKLIQIFEDEYEYHGNLIREKIKHLFNINTSKTIGARKLTIKAIDKTIAEGFLNEYHIQGYGKQNLSLGGYLNNELVAVMSFKKLKDGSWELVRYATDFKYRLPGVGSKFIKHFVKSTENVTDIISFADRRWTLDQHNNLYTKIGFELVDELKPDYKYFNTSVDRYRRFHKFGFRKQLLSKKYNLPISMTETEMIKSLGYDRVWDCGLFKYKYTIR